MSVQWGPWLEVGMAATWRWWDLVSDVALGSGPPVDPQSTTGGPSTSGDSTAETFGFETQEKASNKQCPAGWGLMGLVSLRGFPRPKGSQQLRGTKQLLLAIEDQRHQQ